MRPRRRPRTLNTPMPLEPPVVFSVEIHHDSLDLHYVETFGPDFDSAWDLYQSVPNSILMANGQQVYPKEDADGSR